MRIGIYTLPLRTNFGGILQAWALQTVLRRMGHNVTTFAPYPYKHLAWWRKPLVYTKRIVSNICGNNVPIHYEKKFNTEYDIKTQYLRPFIESNIRIRKYKNIKEIQSANYDVLIAGSDQIWRPKYNNCYGLTIENAFFEFAQDWNVKRLAYAVSFGTDEWEFTPEQTARCSKLATFFNSISVRETSGVIMCQEKLGVKATHVLDPTMLLTSDDYINLIQNSARTSAPSGNLLCYILDETKDTKKLIHHIEISKNLIPFRANSKINDPKANIIEKIQPSVEQWLRDFFEAEFVVTDSFHACVFSIIFNKPFVVIANKERGISRYESLLSELNLSDHLIFSSSDFDPSKDYEVTPDTFEKLHSMRKDSLQFLKSNLSLQKCN